MKACVLGYAHSYAYGTLQCRCDGCREWCRQKSAERRARRTPEQHADDLARARELKEGYRGRCIDCGKNTSYNGRDTSGSERCQTCRKEYERAQKVWTGEAIIDAIHRFAAANGRPPKSTEWIRADPLNHYPPRSNVSRSSRRHTAPFATWADAIEAAGFPRPQPGRYERTPAIREKLREAQRSRRERERQAA